MLKDFSKNALNSIGLNRKKESPIRRGGLAYNITQESGSKSKSPLNLEAVLKKLVPDPLRKRLEKDWRDMTKSWDPVAGVLGLAQNMSKTVISSVETVSANLTDQVKTDFRNAFITLGMIGSNPRESNQTSNPASSIIQRTQNASDGTSISAEVLLVNLIEEVEEDFRDAFDELTKNFTPVASVFQLAQNMSDIFVSSVESGSANLTDQVKGDFRNALSTLSKIGSNPGEFLISASQTPLGKFVDPYNWTSQAIHKYTELRERVGNVTLMFKDSDFIDPNRDKEGIAHVLRMIPKLVPFLIDQKLPELYRFLLLGREFTVDDLFGIHEALENLDAFLGDTSEDLSDYDAPTAEAILALLRSRNMDVMLFILRLMYEADSGDKDQQQTVILNEKHLKALQERFVTANDIFSLLV